jgi:RHS repeat-associated protein
VKKTVAWVATTFLVDPQNPTGYAQVVQENYNGSTSANRELNRVFVYGLGRISQLRSYVANNQNQTQTSYYVYDGHGSTRALTDPTGAVTDTYDYDAFGNLIHSTGTGIPPGGTSPAPTPNEFLFAGEQFDSDLNLYYNRARYLNVSIGRFWTMDRYEGDDEAPLSLHKYLYVLGDPVNDKDPSGDQDEIEEAAGEAGGQVVDNIPTINAFQTLQNVKAALTVTAGLGAKVLSDPSVIEEIEGTGEAGIAVVQRSFMQMETVLSEAEAEATSLAENGSRAREVLNQLYTRFPSPNPANIQYHHIVEQGGANASRFARALQSFGNIIPLPQDIHELITSFYNSSTQVWLSNGMRVRDWMAAQDWETQWSAGLEIVKEALSTGRITWHP